MIFGRKQAPAPPQPDIRCKCGATEFTRICPILSARYSLGGVEWREIGARVSCQRCGEVFSVTHLGIFPHDPRALPPSPLMVPPQMGRREPETPRGPMREDMPTPIARPRT